MSAQEDKKHVKPLATDAVVSTSHWWRSRLRLLEQAHAFSAIYIVTLSGLCISCKAINRYKHFVTPRTRRPLKLLNPYIYVIRYNNDALSMVCQRDINGLSTVVNRIVFGFSILYLCFQKSEDRLHSAKVSMRTLRSFALSLQSSPGVIIFVGRIGLCA